MSDIFLSYAHEDRVTARRLADDLERRGYSVWWDRIIPPGKTFAAYIEERLAEAKCVIVLWSPHAVASQWVVEEVTEGLNRRILIPAMIGDVQIPFGFRQLHAANLTRWQGTPKYPALDLLVQSAQDLVGKAPTDARKPKQAETRRVRHPERTHKSAAPKQAEAALPQPTLR